MVVWYEVAGRKYLAFPKFDENQPGMRKDREPPSTIPSPDQGIPVNAGKLPAQLRLTDGKPPAEVEEKIKGSRKEVEGKERPASPRAPKQPTEVWQVVEIWQAGWVERFQPADGRAPKPDDVDCKQVKNLIATHGLEKTKALVVRFLDDTDKFVAERGHMLRDLPSRVARYAKGDGPLFKAGNVAPREAVEVGGDVTEEWTR
jgi:hypothetical protein